MRVGEYGEIRKSKELEIKGIWVEKWEGVIYIEDLLSMRENGWDNVGKLLDMMLDLLKNWVEDDYIFNFSCKDDDFMIVVVDNINKVKNIRVLNIGIVG